MIGNNKIVKEYFEIIILSVHPCRIIIREEGTDYTHTTVDIILVIDHCSISLKAHWLTKDINS